MLKINRLLKTQNQKQKIKTKIKNMEKVKLSKIKKPSFISFANFYGVNIPSMICFKSQHEVTETTTMMSWNTELGRDTNSGLV